MGGLGKTTAGCNETLQDPALHDSVVIYAWEGVEECREATRNGHRLV